MQSHARVVVVGGGVGGLSALYHLTQEGWTDVVLLERNELTSGTTWHSAAQCPSVAFNQLLLLLRDYTINLYKELAEDAAYPINYHYGTGGMRLLTNPNHVDEVHHIMSVAKGLGINFELLDPVEAKRRNPLLETQGVLAALWDEKDGDIDPAQLCQALAARSRKAGAAIHRNSPVTGLKQLPNGEWLVTNDKGAITAEHIVIAAGYRVNEVGALMGIEYPVIAMEHMYFVTEDIPDLVALDERVPMVRCPRDTFYMRQEKKGLLVGIYEHDCRTFGMDGIDPDFVNALCPDDLDRLLPKMEPIFDRLPCLQEVGIKSVVNGPISYASDAGPLVGKQPGLRNCWSMNGLRVGIGEGGGYGRMLAQMIVHGETEWDTWQLDPRRITSFANTEYTALKSIEDYQHEFRWHLPHEHRPAGRPAKASPLYPVLKAKGAEFGVVNGWERTDFYKPSNDFTESHGYRFQNSHDVVGAEVKALTNNVGLAELSGFNRYRISGTGTLEWLSSLTCSRLSSKNGKASLCYFLTPNGNIAAEATIVPLPSGDIFYGSAATAEYHDMDWLTERLPEGADIRIESCTNTHTMLVVAGPKTRDLLTSVSPRTKWGQQDFPWLTAQRVFIGHVETLALAISYSGEQAFELHIPNSQLYAAYEILTHAGAQFNLTHFGMYAIDSMRLEKGYGHWKGDFVTEYNPIEAGLHRFVDLDKEFPGKKGLQAQMAAGNRKERIILVLDTSEAPAQPGEGVFVNGTSVGSITSAAWGYRTGSNLAMAYVNPEHAVIGSVVDVLLFGKPVQATVCKSCLFDPRNTIPRGIA
ncbi:GcvT family protein [Roseovarius aestuarii]|uniref:4-methylaminobutanoate oxidase (Formaldehyde-forming) n=2 Tax=Roseovarius aestuarii TaxID=475083 RepID=A0A1X7BSM1_9RHOB|nr:FAD-dependent oxidoreductase [Roseovarius aestuarii]SMC12641.1 4-methylaminobutanoate oxidase (formaldehyde-forming) [Roseovarius aestuarii]